MPFTLSHAAAVLPGIRRDGTGRGQLVASALVAGSFAPDMTYFADTAIPGAMEFGQVTHAVWGVFTVDVLITAATVALWQLLREPLVALLPRNQQGRVYALLRGSRRAPGRGRRGSFVWIRPDQGAGSGGVHRKAEEGAMADGASPARAKPRAWGTSRATTTPRGAPPEPASPAWSKREALGVRDGAWFVASAVIGAGTHVVWDAFTHHDRWGVRLVPVLGRNAGGFPVFQLVQYGSSAVALTVLTWFTVSGLRRAGARPVPAPVPVLDRRARWCAGGVIGLCVLLGAVHRCARWYAYFGHIDTPLDIIPTACFGAGAGMAVGLVLYGAWMRLRGRGADAPPPPAAERARSASPSGD